jgi:hypothetical protein
VVSTTWFRAACEGRTSFGLLPESILLLAKRRAFCGAIYEAVTNPFAIGNRWPSLDGDIRCGGR